jgi:outer membrane protein assembly factor BamB
MAAPSLALPRRGLAVGVVVVLVVAVLAVGLAAVLVRARGGDCRAATAVPARSPLLDRAGMVEQPDERLDTLAAAVAKMGAPFGPVRAGVGYDYDQWLHLYAAGDGLLAWTKNNAPVTLLDGTSLEARWSLRPESNRTAFDVVDGSFVLLDLSSKKPTRIAAYSLRSGKQTWCSDLTASHHDGDPVTTARLVGRDLVVALPAGPKIRYTVLDEDTGKQRWQHDLTGTARADFVGAVPGNQFVAGGVEEYRLAQPDPRAPGGPVIGQFRTRDGSRVWSWSAAPGEQAHVVGLAYDRPVVMVRNAGGTALLALSATGSELWRVRPRDGASQATLRGDTVVTRTDASLDGYDVGTGKLLWHRDLPTDRTYFPYGFTLDQMPSLDAGTVLMPTTSSLVVLDVRTGRQRELAMPTDGVSTTYWPYQLVSTDRLIGVVTNTGGVLADRDVGGLG